MSDFSIRWRSTTASPCTSMVLEGGVYFISTTDALLIVTHDIQAALDQGGEARLIALDLSDHLIKCLIVF